MRWLAGIILFLFSLDCFAQQYTIEERELRLPDKIIWTPVGNQFMSSTCWSFASTAFLESEMMRNGLQAANLSEMFVARHSYIRKMRTHIMCGGTNYFTPGGQFHDVMWVIRNYGMMPESAYSGLPNDNLFHFHAELDTLMSRYVHNVVRSGRRIFTNDDQEWADSVLDHYLGKVPLQFFYEGTLYTPFSFAERVLQVNTDDYIEITSFEDHPFNSPYVLADKYNWTGDAYLNVSLSDFTAITDAALKQGYTVCWDGDADDGAFHYADGLAYFPGDTVINQHTRQRAVNDHSFELNHMMQIVGLSYDREGKKWYCIKNSWGSDSNPAGGMLFMRDDYFRLRTTAIIVNRNAIPATIRGKFMFSE